jgi:hypothetical protein
MASAIEPEPMQAMVVLVNMSTPAKSQNPNLQNPKAAMV